jgi:predicted AAA+ superfamily ATPase
MNELFNDQHVLPHYVRHRLGEGNPWWSGSPAKQQPAFKRWPFEQILKGFERKLTPVILLRGPRRVGKTTLQSQVIESLLASGKVHPNEIMHVQFDDLPDWPEFRKFSQSPILDISYWFAENVLRMPFNQLARSGRTAYLFFDEVQNLPDWAGQVKNLVDHADVRVLVTGSSALHIGLGKESLAGRATQINVGPLRLWEIGAMGRADLPPYASSNGGEVMQTADFWKGLAAHGLKHQQARADAFRWFSERGGYPFAQERKDEPWDAIAEVLRDTVVNRVVQKDLIMGESKGKKRDPRLLEATFHLSCRYNGQYPAPLLLADEIRRTLQGNIGSQRVMYYLRFLDQAMLLRLIPPLEIRLKRRKGYDKICLCDHALRAASFNEIIPLHPEGLERNPDAASLAGHLIEGTIGYFLSEISELSLNHFPARTLEPEVDFVAAVGDRRIPIEVKYTKSIDEVRDAMGLKRFLEKADNRAAFGLLITREDTGPDPDPRIIRMPASSLLLLR